MLKHGDIWFAIDTLAQRNNLSVSALARLSGLDPTTFNRSKRINASGKERWPTTESISKILDATGCSLMDFIGLIPGIIVPDGTIDLPCLQQMMDLQPDTFSRSGTPFGRAWESISISLASHRGDFGIKVSDPKAFPGIAPGSTVLVSTAAEIRPGDKIVVQNLDFSLSMYVLQSEKRHSIEVTREDDVTSIRRESRRNIRWMSRVVGVLY